MKMIMRRRFYQLFPLIVLFGCLSLKAEKIDFIKRYELGSEDKHEEMFFQILDAKVSANGDIYILDSGNNCIKRFSKAYNYLGKAGKQGQGPGEMMTPLGIAIDKDENIYLNDLGNRRINIYNKELKFMRAIGLEKLCVSIFIDSDSKMLLLGSPKVLGEKYFNKFSLEGKLISSFCDIFHPYAPRLRSQGEFFGNRRYISLAVYFVPRANMNQDGTLIAFTHLIPENPYKISIMNSGGDVLKLISKKIKDYDPEKQRSDLESLAIKTKPSLSGYSVSICGLHFTKEDYLVVQRRHDIYKNGSLASTEYMSDVFSPDGNLMQEEIKTEKILSIDDENNVYAVREEETGVVKVIIYSLKIIKE